MPIPTYDLITSTILSAQADTVTFSGIPGTYRDLILVCRLKTASSGGPSAIVRINTDTGENYRSIFTRGNGTTVTSGGGGTSNWVTFDDGLYMNSSDFTYMAIAEFMDYASNKYKVVLTRSGQTTEPLYSGFGASIATTTWQNTTAITSLRIDAFQAVAGSSFSLYGVAG